MEKNSIGQFDATYVEDAVAKLTGIFRGEIPMNDESDEYFAAIEGNYLTNDDCLDDPAGVLLNGTVVVLILRAYQLLKDHSTDVVKSIVQELTTTIDQAICYGLYGVSEPVKPDVDHMWDGICSFPNYEKSGNDIE